MNNKIRFPDFSNAQVGDKVTWLVDSPYQGLHLLYGNIVDIVENGVLATFPGRFRIAFSFNGYRLEDDLMPFLYHGHLSTFNFQPKDDGAYKRGGE